MAGLIFPNPVMPQGRDREHERGNLRSVDFAARRAQRQRLRSRYLGEPWTRKECVIPGCGDKVFQLHHSTYGQPQTTEMLALVPLCDFHHAMFEHKIWPSVKDVFPRSLVTMDWVVHGEALLDYIEEWWTPIIVDDRTHVDQLALWP